MRSFQRSSDPVARCGGVWLSLRAVWQAGWSAVIQPGRMLRRLAWAVAWTVVWTAAAELAAGAQEASAAGLNAASQSQYLAGSRGVKAARPGEKWRGSLPPRVAQAERFLAERGWTGLGKTGLGKTGTRAQRLSRSSSRSLAGELVEARAGLRIGLRANATQIGSLASAAQSTPAGSATWQAIGPTAVETSTYGLVSGRISALALDPSDAAGNHLYVGTTGGGVWQSSNAGSSTVLAVAFSPMTDTVPVLSGALDASISIGALTVQPGGGCATGGAGVILAGTGDPNDALDSYYGAGILRSTDCGTTWSVIQTTADQSKTFVGEGFAGFAWATPNPVSDSFSSSTVNQDLVVAAVSQAYEGTLVNALVANDSYEGLYYSTNSGATWTLATITDGGGADVQGASDVFTLPDGNAATSVVWNPARQLFIAAVRYHGYYQSADGITFTRLSAQPGTNLTSTLCPTNSGAPGSEACPIFRGTLAVNPETGDAFAWTVDISNQDQGLWRDTCAITSSGVCTNTAIAFATQLNTALLETNDPEWGENTIENGDYNLALAAVPTELDAGADTILLAGANDLWRCSLAMGCQWRNTTNATTCMSAKVGEFQHALAWNAVNPQEIFIGNDSGLWRSTDAINESPASEPEPVCASSDASHFQNLNGELGSLAESVSLAQSSATPYALMTGLGVNGTAGVNDSAQPSGNWPQILSGYGGPAAIGPSGGDWYVNSEAGVFIQKCAQPSSGCTAADFGTIPAIDMNDEFEDGSTMTVPAPFLVDPLDSTNLLVGTCRLWRVPADGSGWGATNAVSPILDGGSATYCSGNALIRSIAAMALPVSTALPNGGEVVYVGMYGAENGGEGVSLLPGHVLRATIVPNSSAMPAWTDLTQSINPLDLDISSIVIDSHDGTGQTVYGTVEGVSMPLAVVQPVYRSTDGGASWTSIASNLPSKPVSGLVVDPQDANTVYVATDVGVYSTRTVASCAASSCWSPFGAGLPGAPVVALSATPATASEQLLTAATYGRGIWQTPLWTGTASGSGPATDTLSPTALTFPGTIAGQISAAQTVSLTNSGGANLTSISTSVSGPFTVTNNCTANLASTSSCTISVFFQPVAAGAQTGTLTVSDSLRTQTVSLSGTGLLPPAFSVNPPSLSFAMQAVGTSSAAQTLTVTNTGGAPMANVSFQLTGTSVTSFATGTTTCGATLASGSNCTVQVTFAPAASSGSTATLVISSSTLGVTAAQVPLTGNGGGVAASIQVSPGTISFAATGINESSSSTTVTITNPGSSASLSNLTLAVSAGFQLVNNTCASLASGTLAAQANCTAGVVFAPTSTGAQTGTLTVTSSTVATGATVALSGIGTDFSVAISGSSSQTISSGATADYTLAIAPLGGAQATYAFQCGTLPENALCLFSPASETIGGSATGNATLEISTGQSIAALRPGADSMPGRGGELPLLSGLLALPLAWKGRRKALLAVALLMILAGGVSSCSGSGGGVGGGGGSGGGGTSGATPAGTYSIPVTVTSNGIEHSVTVTLVVD
jgi:hypothetical protein